MIYLFSFYGEWLLSRKPRSTNVAVFTQQAHPIINMKKFSLLIVMDVINLGQHQYSVIRDGDTLFYRL